MKKPTFSEAYGRALRFGREGEPLRKSAVAAARQPMRKGASESAAKSRIKKSHPKAF
jgi:hypothetical protein